MIALTKEWVEMSAHAMDRNAEQALSTIAKNNCIRWAELCRFWLAHQWQTIETAPKDGTPILLHWPYWSTTPIICQFNDGRWHSDRVLSSGGDGPKGWQPLPPLPDPPKETP